MIKERISELYYEELGDKFQCYLDPFDAEHRIKVIKKLLPKEIKNLECLEVGCGTGDISRAIVSLVKKLTVSDISAKLAKRIGKELGVSWRQEDACQLNIPNETYDIVVSSECIEHTLDPKKAILEMARVIKPGGSIIFTSPNKLWYPLLVLVQLLKLRKFQGNELWLFPFQAREVLRRCNFSDLRIKGVHLFPWQIPGAKKILPLFNRGDAYLFPFMINYAIFGRKKMSRN